jgi:excisionase family DNA binding protein
MGVPADWRSRATVTVPEYAAIMGIGRATAYEAARAGEIPTIRFRRRIVVPVPAIIRQLEGGSERPTT